MENLNTITVPSNLFFALDNNLRVALVVLLSLSNRLSNKDGYFYRTNEDLQSDFKLGKNLTIAVLESLYQYGLIEVRTTHRLTNYYRINMEKFKEYEQENLYNITKNKELHLNTVNYKEKGFKVTYNTERSSTSLENQASRDIPSHTPKNVSTALKTSNPDTLNDLTPNSKGITDKEIDEIGEMWVEHQKQLTPRIEYRSISKLNNSVKQCCKELVKRYVEMTIPSSNESLDKSNKAINYITNQYRKGYINIEDKNELVRELIQARFKKHRI